MAAGFHRASLSIALDCEVSDFVADQDQNRVYLHELLHFWQTLSQGYITRQALLEWQRLQRFEETGDVSPHSELDGHLHRFFHKHPLWGFSAWNLSEALARFWDIQLMNPRVLLENRGRAQDVPPHNPGFRDIFQQLEDAAPGWSQVTSENFDYLMQLEDWYAAPYRAVLQKVGSAWAAALFPLIGHFSLQSPSPVEVFATALSDWFERVVYAVEFAKRRADPSVDWRRIPRGISIDFAVFIRILTGQAANHVIDEQGRVDIELAWLLLTPHVLQVCHEAAMRVCDGRTLEPGWDVIERTELKDHPVFRYLLAFLQRVIHLTPEQFVNKFGKSSPVSYQNAFALPGSVLGHSMLRRYFLPPLVFLRDIPWPVWKYYAECEPLSLAEPKLIEIAGASIARESFEIRTLERRFEKALVFSRFHGLSESSKTGHG
jgi:hypothetical protein